MNPAPPAATAESPYAWFRLVMSLALMTLGGAGMYSVTVVLPRIQADFDVARGDASLPYTLTMVGFGLGGILEQVATDAANLHMDKEDLMADFMASYQETLTEIGFNSREIARFEDSKPRRDRLAPGDLVLFGDKGAIFHVGIYVGEGRFVHAPSTGGTVRLDRLDGPYWGRHYAGARRILD